MADFTWEEGQVPQGFKGVGAAGARCTPNFHAVNSNGGIINPAYMQLIGVHAPTSSGNMAGVSGKFELEVVAPNKAFIYCTDKLWYSENSNNNTYTFSIAITQNGYSQIKTIDGNLRNSVPFGGYLGTYSAGNTPRESTP